MLGIAIDVFIFLSILNCKYPHPWDDQLRKDLFFISHSKQRNSVDSRTLLDRAVLRDLPIDIEFHRKMIADTQRFIQWHSEALLEVHCCITPWYNSLHEVIAVDQNAVVGARLTSVGFYFVFDHPDKISVVNRPTKPQMNRGEMALGRTGVIFDASLKCTSNRHSDRQWSKSDGRFSNLACARL